MKFIHAYGLPLKEPRSAHDGPTIHAFAHSISTVLTYLREEISQRSTMVALQGQQLSAIYMQYAIYEDILTALSSFYGRVRG